MGRISNFTYTPVLRNKPAEREALAKLGGTDTLGIQPIIELLPEGLEKALTQKIAPENYFATALVELYQCWGKPAYIDITYFSQFFDTNPELTHLYRAFIARSRNIPFQIIPVVTFGANESNVNYLDIVRELIAENHLGAAIRITPKRLLSSKIKPELDELINHLGVSLDEFDFILDGKTIHSQTRPLSKVIPKIPYLNGWRNFTFIGGSLPLDLGGLELGPNLLERKEWQFWKTSIKDPSLDRYPGFGDYGVRHSIYVQERDHFIPSQSVRYTTDDHFLIMKGEKKYGSKQYLAHAQRICEHPSFKGPEFSPGDEYAFEKSNEAKKINRKQNPGNSTSWIFASTSHHLANITHQLRAIEFDISSEEGAN